MPKRWSDRKVILLVGPAGAGKTSMGQRIARVPTWTHLSEDLVWNELNKAAHTPRTPEEKAIVQPRTLAYLEAELNKGNNIVLEFIIYEDPPQPLIFYQAALKKLGVPFQTRALRPSLEEILIRQTARGNRHDRELDVQLRRENAALQIRCLSSDKIDQKWVIDSSGMSIEQIYQDYFADLVEPLQESGR